MLVVNIFSAVKLVVNQETNVTVQMEKAGQELSAATQGPLQGHVILTLAREGGSA